MTTTLLNSPIIQKLENLFIITVSTQIGTAILGALATVATIGTQRKETATQEIQDITMLIGLTITTLALITVTIILTRIRNRIRKQNPTEYNYWVKQNTH